MFWITLGCIHWAMKMQNPFGNNLKLRKRQRKVQFSYVKYQTINIRFCVWSIYNSY